jgi:hypothetical protein
VTGTTAAHPLVDARAEQEASDLNSKLGQLVYQAIIDHLAKHGEVHADDLEGYYPPEHRDRCRKLAPGQLGSLRGRKYIQPTKEYRKSKVKARKGAKSWVYIFTLKGRGLVGVGGGFAAAVSLSGGAATGHSPHSGESPARVTTGVASSKGARVGSSPSPTGASSDPGGQGPPASSAPLTDRSVGEPCPTPEPVPLFEEEKPPSAYDPFSEAA